MRVIVFGATGGLGQHVWRAAVDAGHDVTVFVRSPGKLDAEDSRHAELSVWTGDVMDAAAVRSAATGCVASVNCTSPASGNATLDLAKSIVGNASAAGVARFYMVAGMGALWAPGTERTILLQDWDDADAMRSYGLPPGMPRETIRAMTKGHLASMAYMARTALPHAFVCPGAMFEGPASTERVVTLDELGGHGAMRISFADVAQVIVDDLDPGSLLGHRVCVAPH
jgi:putative NADH-flavin reductase